MIKTKNVVTIGGGAGSFTLLSGLKKYPINLSAIVSMADDGGSTGVLRDELGVLPPGDVRQCLVALSDSTETLRALMNFRFEGGGLSGHNFGNLFLSALEKIKGSFALGAEEAAEILNVKGEVIPVSEENMKLHIKLNNKKVLVGENHLDHNADVREKGVQSVYLQPKVKAYRKALAAIKAADFIIIGPGDHFGSIIPNLLVSGIAGAIKKSRAKVIYNCNLTNKKGQTEKFDVERYVDEINSYIGKNRIDIVTVNSKNIPAKLIAKYEKREGRGTIVELGDRNAERSFKIALANLLNDAPIKKTKGDPDADSHSFIRHDPNKLARVLMAIMEISKHKG
ncbi:MAG: gluconeogenesis factor YvcK family protein [Parcubacteria group bacterium]|jgi:uncharacterized cofD-like protein